MSNTTHGQAGPKDRRGLSPDAIRAGETAAEMIFARAGRPNSVRYTREGLAGLLAAVVQSAWDMGAPK